MKVLLLGEYSSLHRYLKEGLQKIDGVDVKLFANGDGWKNISGADGAMFEWGKGKLGRIKTITSAFKIAKTLKNYDVVQIINPQIYPSLINTKIIKKLKKNNKIVSMVAAGYDYALLQAYNNSEFDYYMLQYDKYLENYYSSDKMSGKQKIKSENQVVEASDIIIPSLYEYTLGYKKESKLSNVIPFPINTDKIEYAENTFEDKVVFFHGINREESKGTAFIREALERLKNNYPNEVEVVIDGHMPFDKYVELMKRTNVVVDQCCSYGYGINACLAMAQGKVVMSGNRPETLKAFGIDKSPIFHIQPDVDTIYQQLVYILENKKNIGQWGYESRQYVESTHNYITIAQKYVDAWKSTGKI